MEGGKKRASRRQWEKGERTLGTQTILLPSLPRSFSSIDDSLTSPISSQASSQPYLSLPSPNPS